MNNGIMIFEITFI